MIHPLTPIYTPRLVLRCWKPTDAALLKDALDCSLNHLFRFSLWSRVEPSSLESLETRLAGFAADFRDGRDFVYGIFNRDETAVLGGTGLHPLNGPEDREIGYWLRESATGQGFATESTAALTTVAFATWPLETVTIVCDPDNRRSAAVPARLGYACQGTFPAKAAVAGRELDLIWRTSRAAWAARSPLNSPRVLVAR
jgi:RimJ/RimL family protein N-acetyltransferase